MHAYWHASYEFALLDHGAMDVDKAKCACKKSSFLLVRTITWVQSDAKIRDRDVLPPILEYPSSLDR